uniref:Uncharacterized protein n=1 Tax=Globisporangium ultimum (strain ATCC 200006 / CBS 805.95 / DAOM BR144) TaxID=431595 RepID=K3X6B0_GLOUD
MMTAVRPSSVRENGRVVAVALVVFGLVVVSFLNYYGMARSASSSAAIDTEALPALHSSSPHHLKTGIIASSHAGDVNVVPAAHTVIDLQGVHKRSQLYQANEDLSQMHIVFSMSCTQGKRRLLQTVFQFSAMAVGQKGPITQILSGCTDAEREAVMKEPTFYYDFRRHFTPSYSPHPEPGITDDYTPYNKPFALRHFLTHADPPVNQEMVVLVDADFVWFKPLEVNTGRDISKYYHGKRDKATVTDTVKDGYAIAQDWYNYMGAGWFGEGNRPKLEHLCTGKPCINVTQEDAAEYFAGTGPPYIMTTSDMRRMIDDYSHFVVLGRNLTDDWMVEMYAYAVAAGSHGIKHTLMNNLGVTHPQFVDGDREHWKFVSDELMNPCTDPYSVVIPEDPPVGVHYCQKYGFVQDDKSGYHYYKYKIPEDIIECKAPLLKLPPATEWTDAIAIKDSAKRAQKRHEVWTECSLIKIVNQALLKLKQTTCPTGFNAFQGTELKGNK